MKKGKDSFYAKYSKRGLDIFCSSVALTVLSPVFVGLTLAGALDMKGNPFFVQERPGKDEKLFKLIKFRTMSDECDKDGNLLPDEDRMSKYGALLRTTSLDELPEAINILKGDMSVVGPRPWLVEYLPYYTEEERKRHSIKPGLTGWAQINGRNKVEWDSRIQLDLFYVDNISFMLDARIVLTTIGKFIKRSDILEDTQVVEGNLAAIRRMKLKEENCE